MLLDTLSRITTLDEIIQKRHLSGQWIKDKHSRQECLACQLVPELLFGDHEHVPPKVAIDEAIGIAKNYSESSMSEFVNRLLECCM